MLRRPRLAAAAVGGSIAAVAALVAAGPPVSSALHGPTSARQPVAVALEHPPLGLPPAGSATPLAPVPRAPVVGSLGDALRAKASAAAASAAASAAAASAAASAAAASASAAASPAPSGGAPASGTPVGQSGSATHTAAPAPALQPADLLGGGIPVVALNAYVRAAAHQATLTPACHLSWAVLAGIGRVESNHGQIGGRVLASDGRAAPPIIGPRLDGTKYPAIHDSDGGRLDGDPAYDRAVGPLQFLPSTWARWGRDGDGDGTADPQDINDAAAAAAAYLCVSGSDLRDGAALGRALWSYNHDAQYVMLVAGVAAEYAVGRR